MRKIGNGQMPRAPGDGGCPVVQEGIPRDSNDILWEYVSGEFVHIHDFKRNVCTNHLNNMLRSISHAKNVAQNYTRPEIRVAQRTQDIAMRYITKLCDQDEAQRLLWLKEKRVLSLTALDELLTTLWLVIGDHVRAATRIKHVAGAILWIDIFVDVITEYDRAVKVLLKHYGITSQQFILANLEACTEYANSLVRTASIRLSS
jgi:hypothetical protein